LITVEEKGKKGRIFRITLLFKINPKNSPTESCLSSAEQQIVIQIDGKTTLQNIISALSLEKTMV